MYSVTRYYICKLACVIFQFARLSPAPVGLFPRSRLQGTQGAARTPRRNFGSRGGSVARALGVQSREIWQVIAGFSRSSSRARQWKTRMSSLGNTETTIASSVVSLTATGTNACAVIMCVYRSVHCKLGCCV